MPRSRVHGLLLLSCAACAGERWTPVAAGLTREHQLFDATTAVYGARLDLVSGRSRRVAGVDVNGWWGAVDAGSGGAAVALGGNQFAGDYFGVQVAGGVNRTEPIWGLDPVPSDEHPPTCYGAQVALGANFADLWGVQVGAMNGWPKTHDSVGNTVRGVQVGLIDGAGTCAGVQLAAVCTFTGDAYGVQIAPVNIVHDRAYGLQIGLFNRAGSGGLQLGLLNWNAHGLLPVLPLLNFGFGARER